jgi:hypothetical protein
MGSLGNICSDNEGTSEYFVIFTKEDERDTFLKKNIEVIRKGVPKVVPTQQKNA